MPGIPKISSIQRTNALLALVGAAAIACLVSLPSAIGLLVGAAVVMINLLLLSMMGQMLLAAAGKGGAAARLGAAALPLKLLLLAGLIYFVFLRWHVDGLGFALGVLTQFAAIIIETGRAWSGRTDEPAIAEESCRNP